MKKILIITCFFIASLITTSCEKREDPLTPLTVLLNPTKIKTTPFTIEINQYPVEAAVFTVSIPERNSHFYSVLYYDWMPDFHSGFGIVEILDTYDIETQEQEIPIGTALYNRSPLYPYAESYPLGNPSDIFTPDQIKALNTKYKEIYQQEVTLIYK